MNTNRVAILRISIELLQQICTTGWRVGDNEIVECIKGIPDGAEFVTSYVDTETASFCLIFRHESFEPIRDKIDAVPILDIEHSYQARTDPAKAKLLAALEAVEWVEESDEDDERGVRCHWCKRYYFDWETFEHAPDCQRQAAIAAAKGE